MWAVVRSGRGCDNAAAWGKDNIHLYTLLRGTGKVRTVGGYVKVEDAAFELA